MKKLIFKLTMAIAIGATQSSPALTQPTSERIRNSLSVLTNVFDDFRSKTPNSNEMDESVFLACESVVFSQWADGVLQMLGRTPNLSLQVMGQPLADFGQELYRTLDDESIFDYEQPQLTSLIAKQLSDLRTKHGVLAVKPETLTLDDLQINGFLANLRLCAQTDVFEAMLAAAPALPPNDGLPVSGDDYKVTWICNVAGGIAPQKVMCTGQDCHLADQPTTCQPEVHNAAAGIGYVHPGEPITYGPGIGSIMRVDRSSKNYKTYLDNIGHYQN